MRILIIDDKENIRFVIKEMIKGMFQGLEIFEASDGGEGISVTFREKGKINLVITDYRMSPGENGFEVSRFIKETYPEIKVIMLTGESISKEGEEPSEFEKTAIVLGIKKIIQKPPDWEKFKNCVREVIGKI